MLNTNIYVVSDLLITPVSIFVELANRAQEWFIIDVICINKFMPPLLYA